MSKSLYVAFGIVVAVLCAWPLAQAQIPVGAVPVAEGAAAAPAEPAAAAAVTDVPPASGTEPTIQELNLKLSTLEQRVAELENLIAPMRGQMQARSQSATLRSNFTERMKQDKQTFTPEQLNEIESLYQVCNKQWNTAEARRSANALIEKYGQSNRAGCALLYKAQWYAGEEREKLLRSAIAQYEDCWYGDGVQVGAYARFILANYLKEKGKPVEARELFDEIREKFPDAVNHQGEKLVDMIGL